MHGSQRCWTPSWGLSFLPLLCLLRFLFQYLLLGFLHILPSLSAHVCTPHLETLGEDRPLLLLHHGVGLDGAGYVNHAPSLHSPHWLRQAWREEATTSRCQRRMSSEASSTLRESGALASRSRLLKGHRTEGSRERLKPSDVRHSLR